MNASGVGAIGGGMSAAGAVAAPADASAAAGVCGTQLGAVNTSALIASGVPIGLSNLVSALQGFSSAEILMALMMLGGGQDDKKKTPDLAMAMLAGMALGGQLNTLSANQSSAIPGVGASGMAGGGAGAGMQINIQA